MITVVPATAEHAAALALRMRAEDAAECEAIGMTPLASIEMSLRVSDLAYAAFVDGEVMGIYGVAPLTVLGDIACPWLLTADGAVRHRRAFLEENRAFLRFALQRYPVLVTYVDARYSQALRWMRWLGFTVDEAAPFGPLNALFCKATLRM